MFVYGTLKRGFYNNHVLVGGGAHFMCDAVTVQQWPLVRRLVLMLIPVIYRV